MPSVPGYLYATRGDSVYVNLFAKGTANIDLPGGAITIDQDTRYPWDGAVKMTVKPKQARRFAINVRIPGWARNEPVPSKLYASPTRSTCRAATLRVNGTPVPTDARQGLRDDRSHVDAGRRASRSTCRCRCAASSRIRQVMANRDRVALQRGPIVYAAEWPDNPNGKVRNIVLPDGNALDDRVPPRSAERRPGDQGTRDRSRLRCQGRRERAAISRSWRFRMRRGRIAAAGRWRCGSRAPMPPPGRRRSRPSSPPRRSRRRRCRTAAARTPRNIIDGEEPANSSDSSAYFDWWPVQGSKMEWVELTFAKPSTVSTSEIYWFDDTGRGGVRVPASWRLLYKSGDQWLPVQTTSAYGVARNAWNTIAFTPVTTAALRIELAMQQGFSGRDLQEVGKVRNKRFRVSVFRFQCDDLCRCTWHRLRHAVADCDRHRDRGRHPPHRLQSIAQLRSRLPRIRHDRRGDPRRRRRRSLCAAGDVGRCARSHAGADRAGRRRSTSRTFAPSPARRNSTAASTSIAARPTSGEASIRLQPLAPQLQGMFSRDRSPVWMDATTAAQCREIDAALGGADRTKALTGFSGLRTLHRPANPPVLPAAA